MTTDSFSITTVGLDADLDAAVVALVETAARDLGLGQEMTGIRITADDLPGAEGAWFRLGPGPGEGTLPVLDLFCPPDSFGPAGRASHAVRPGQPVWDQTPLRPEDHESRIELAPGRAAMFLYHHLLTARDLVRGELVGRNLPASLAEAFTEAWAAYVDGRLGRMGLPGYPLDQRRLRFARIFSPAGILLPDHWQVFQSLWDGALTNQKDVLGAVKRLPGL